MHRIGQYSSKNNGRPKTTGFAKKPNYKFEINVQCKTPALQYMNPIPAPT